MNKATHESIGKLKFKVLRVQDCQHHGHLTLPCIMWSVFLLSTGHNNKMILNYLLLHPQTLIREDSPQSRWQLTWRPTAGQWADPRDFWVLWGIYQRLLRHRLKPVESLYYLASNYTSVQDFSVAPSLCLNKEAELLCTKTPYPGMIYFSEQEQLARSGTTKVKSKLLHLEIFPEV